MSPTPITTDNPFLTLLEKVQKRVDSRLSQVLKASEKKGASYGSEVAEMIGAVRSLCDRGGKRLRPGLCYVGALSIQAKVDDKALIEAGVALELLQAYFLLHDDWMDRDVTRRGGPTAHVSLAKVFKDEHLGACSAILAGDHAVALAQAHLLTLDVTPARLRSAMITFADMQLAAVSGQQLDVIAKTDRPELTYELKTASYTVTGPLHLGAKLAGAKPEAISALAAYGLKAGIAFQLQDDLIGVFGDPKKTGKPRGADLAAGKNTPLVRFGLDLLKGTDRKALVAVLSGKETSQKEVSRVATLLESSGAKTQVEARISKLRSESLRVLERSKLTSAGKELLSGAVWALTERNA